jgi:hypothetical protein
MAHRHALLTSATPTAEILRKDILKPRLYPATDNGKLDGKPVFMSVEDWESKKKQIQDVDARGADAAEPARGKEQMFSPEWFRPYTARPKTLNVYIMGDPSKGSNKPRPTAPRSPSSASTRPATSTSSTATATG